MAERPRASAVAPLLLGAFFVVYGARVSIASHGEYRAGRDALEHDDLRAAITHFRRAAKHRVPPFDAVADAHAALLSIGQRAERRGDAETALSAYRSSRAAVHSTRSWLPRSGDVLAQADAGIARVTVRLERPLSLRGVPEAEAEARVLAQLRAAPRESPFFVLLASLGFLLFSATAHAALVPAESGVLARLGRHRWLAAVGFAGFVVGAYLA